MYLRIIDETINYPYSIPQLRNAFPNVSLPAELTDASLIEWDMYVVIPTPMPTDGKPYTWDEETVSWVEITE